MSSNLTPLVLKKSIERSINLRLCIICQEQGKDNELVSTTAGRQNVMNAAEIRKDEVWDRLRSSSVDSEFKYHMNNKCYKSYTHKNKLSKIALAPADIEEQKDQAEDNSDFRPPSPKRTRSTSVSRSGPAPPTLDINPETFRCFICGKKSHNNVKTKYRLSEAPQATCIRNSANILKDDVYARIADLDTNERMFAADLYYHSSCYPSYIEKANRANANANANANADFYIFIFSQCI